MIGKAKTTRGAATVQLDGRGNRTCLPYDKKLTIVDYVLSPDAVLKDYAPYYAADVGMIRVTAAVTEVEDAYKTIMTSGVFTVEDGQRHMGYLDQERRARLAGDNEEAGEAYRWAGSLVSRSARRWQKDLEESEQAKVLNAYKTVIRRLPDALQSDVEFPHAKECIAIEELIRGMLAHAILKDTARKFTQDADEERVRALVDFENHRLVESGKFNGMASAYDGLVVGPGGEGSGRGEGDDPPDDHDETAAKKRLSEIIDEYNAIHGLDPRIPDESEAFFDIARQAWMSPELAAFAGNAANDYPKFKETYLSYVHKAIREMYRKEDNSATRSLLRTLMNDKVMLTRMYAPHLEAMWQECRQR